MNIIKFEGSDKVLTFNVVTGTFEVEILQSCENFRKTLEEFKNDPKEFPDAEVWLESFLNLKKALELRKNEDDLPIFLDTLKKRMDQIQKENGTNVAALTKQISELVNFAKGK